MIYNVIPGTFNSYGIRNGDLIAVVNFVQWFRKHKNNENIKLYFEPNVLKNYDYVHKFYKFLCGKTNCFSTEPGWQNLPYHELMLWDFRDIIGDHVTIFNDEPTSKKVVVFPVYDASYNLIKDWAPGLLESILQETNYQYSNYQKLLCVKDMPSIDLNLYDFSVSLDFMTNIKHIMQCEVFIGGDTGTSHFASALSSGPKQLIYYYNGRTRIHVLPFHLLNGKGTLKKFWYNVEKSTYDGKLI